MALPFTRILQPCLRLFPPELAHDVSLWALRYGLYQKQYKDDHSLLRQNLWGMTFNNPVGMAAGFDKDGAVPDALTNMGFGFVEVGTVTPKPQSGNEKPRVFRLPREHAVINRMGFNNNGHKALLERLQNRNKNSVIGINIGANKLSEDRIEDYIQGIKTLYPVADYFTVNISSPNTPGLRDLQTPGKLNTLLSMIMATRGAMMEAGESWRPILVKLAPDIEDDDLKSTIECLKVNAVDGIIISNTTVSRDGIPDIAIAGQAGGLSGRPLFSLSTRMLAKTYTLIQGQIPLIGVGGIDHEDSALEKIYAGASLIQLYTGLIYQGPNLIHRIKRKIIRTMQDNNYNSISEMVGLKADIWAKNKEF
ncbi:MAG: quinone-dependent dihydroorotate dehydrogenase [Pseudomonadota bacterium]